MENTNVQKYDFFRKPVLPFVSLSVNPMPHAPQAYSYRNKKQTKKSNISALTLVAPKQLLLQSPLSQTPPPLLLPTVPRYHILFLNIENSYILRKMTIDNDDDINEDNDDGSSGDSDDGEGSDYW